MGVVTLRSFTDRQLEDLATDIKNIIMQFMLAEEKITEDEARKYVQNYAILVRKPSFFHRLIKPFKNEDDQPCFYIAKSQKLADIPLEVNQIEEKIDD